MWQWQITERLDWADLTARARARLRLPDTAPLRVRVAPDTALVPAPPAAVQIVLDRRQPARRLDFEEAR